jgi:RHS repeat-associated protein
MVWDAENRLVNYDGTTVKHEYDANGLRVRRSASGSDVAYVFSGSLPVAEYAAGAAATAYSKEYVYLGSQLIATHRPSAPYNTYFMRDHLSIRGAIADSAGYVAPGGGTAANPEEQGHLPFGESWYDSNYAGFGLAPGKWEFTSYERDSTSNDDYAMARRYQYGFGRFASPDPIMGNVGNPQSWNRYSYALSDSLNLTDPTGMNVMICVDTTSWDDETNTLTVTTKCSDLGGGGGGGGGQSPTDPGGAGGGAGGAPNNGPQNKQLKCAGEALKKNGVALALDAASLGVDAFGPEAQYAKLGIGLGLSTAATINSAVHQDMTGAGLGMASYLKAPTELAATSAGWGWAKWIPGAGAVMDVASAIHDGSQAYSDYNSCMAGH